MSAAQSVRGAAGRPVVSVIIPTRDRAELLAGTLAALRAQTYANLEIIVVDDGSVDATGALVARAAREDPRVRGHRHPRSRGAAAARNSGIALGTGAYLLFEDDDCRGHPDRVARLVEALERAPDAAYAYCRMASRNSDGSVTIHGAEGPWSIGTPAALIRSDRLGAVGGFDELLPRLQDFDLWTRLLARWPAVAVPSVLFETVRDDAGISASPERLRAAADRIMAKYERSDLPRRHLAAMHRRLGGKLLVSGFRPEALSHLRQSTRLDRRSLRSWLALAAALPGARVYRRVARLSDGAKRLAGLRGTRGRS